MKRLVISSLLIICVAALVVSLGTFAYFSDSASSTGNTFSAGTLKLNSGSGIITLACPATSNLAPGGTETCTFDIQNTGSIDASSLVVSAAGSGVLFSGATPAVVSVSGCPASLAAGATASCSASVSLPSSADNSYQGVSGSIIVSATATQ